MSILEELKPCADDSSYIDFIIEKIKNADIIKIAMNVIKFAGPILKDLTDAVSSFKNQNY